MSVVLLSFAFFQVWPIVSWNSESVQISGRYRDACFWVRKRATNKQAKRQRDRNVGMHADRQIDRQTVGQTGRQARRQEDRQTILSQIMHSVYALFQTFVFVFLAFQMESPAGCRLHGRKHCDVPSQREHRSWSLHYLARTGWWPSFFALLWTVYAFTRWRWNTPCYFECWAWVVKEWLQLIIWYFSYSTLPF